MIKLAVLIGALSLAAVVTAQNAVSLQTGVRLSAEVQQGTYNYYSFNVGDIEFYQSLSISVIPSSGRPAVYASFGLLPNASVNTWSATSSSAPWSIYLTPTSSGFRKGTLFISVYGVQRTFFDILVESGGIAAIPVNGKAVPGSVVKSFYTYYSFKMSPAFVAQPMVITVTGVTGDPDLYVSPSKQTTRPSSSLYTWRSTAGSGFNEVISISPKDPNYNTDILYLAVAGLQPINNYTLTVTVGSSSTLINGLPTQDSTDSGICKYYDYPITADRWNQTLTAIVNFNFGRAGFYGAWDITRPDPYNYVYGDTTGDYRRILLKPDAILMSPSVLHLSVCADPSVRVAYTITVSSGEATAVCRGMPVTVRVGADRPAYLTVALDSAFVTQGISIKASSQNEIPLDAYASFKNVRPSSLNWDWRGIGQVTIPSKELSNNNLNVGLWTGANMNSYTFQLSPAAPVTKLVNGTSSRGQLETGGSYAFYSVNINNFDTLTIVMTFRTGTASLFVSNVSTWPVADCTSGRWLDTTGTFRRVIIKPGDGGYTAGNYNIVVSSTSAVVYDITATIQSLNK